MKRLISGGAWVVVALTLVGTLLVAGGRESDPAGLAPAADVGQFNPGNIISDAIFFDENAMSAGDVQAFLDIKGIGCRAGSDGSPCLKDFRQDTTARDADAYCAGYGPASGESAATIIAKVAVSCGINPQVLLVMLQKEQGLVRASGTSLYASKYQKAMGFACPDTAPCDAAYYGFQNQVFAAARQYQRYAANPSGFGYRAGRTSPVLYNPDTSCGSSQVYIQNQATAGLYIYTPYQPNVAALAAGYGTGDACSAYGNRNFWLYFTDWFGSTQAPGQSAWQPVGDLDPLTVAARTVSISGWAVDPDDVNGAATVHVYVDGAGIGVLRADQYSTVTASYQGYRFQVPLTVGSHTICTYAINVGRGDQNTTLGCRTVQVGAALGSDPTGGMSAYAAGRSVVVGGWAVDPDALATPLDVHVYVDGAGIAVLNARNPGAPTAVVYPGAGDVHGFLQGVATGPGRHEVCAYAINVGAGTNNTNLGCRTVVLDATAFNPEGAWELMEVRNGKLVVSGWAKDLDATGPIPVHVYVDGVGSVLAAGGPHPTAPGFGFQASLPLTPGSHQVCVYAINAGPGTTNPSLGCRPLTVEASAFNPVGALDAVSATGGTVTLSGWATDPDTTGAVLVHVYLDGRPQFPVAADRPNATADGHGYTAALTASEGVHSVCTYAINVGAGTTNPVLGCKSVTVTANPVGALESVTAVGGTVTVTGWATDGDAAGGVVQVHLYADGAPRFPMVANQPNATSDGHGYTGTLTLSEGSHSVCTYAINVGPGTTNPLLGCRSVTVSSNPSGALENVFSVGSAVTLSGWARDPDTAGAVQVHVYADGRVQFPVLADQPNATADGHGFRATLKLSAGAHTVCTYAINVGAGNSNPLLGCRSVTVSSDPSGALETATSAAGTATITGWAADPDTTGPLQVHVYADGRPQFAVSADRPNATVDGHGYTATLALPAGTHSVCTYAINVGPGSSNPLLGCRSVAVG